MPRLSLWEGTVQDLGKVAAFVADVCAPYQLEGRLIYQLTMAVDEACTNIFEHAYEGKAGRVEIDAECSAAMFMISLRDWGRPFDPSAVRLPDPALPLEERPIGGLGLYLIRKIMDHVEYCFDGAEGNLLVLQKHFQTSP